MKLQYMLELSSETCSTGPQRVFKIQEQTKGQEKYVRQIREAEMGKGVANRIYAK